MTMNGGVEDKLYFCSYSAIKFNNNLYNLFLTTTFLLRIPSHSIVWSHIFCWRTISLSIVTLEDCLWSLQPAVTSCFVLFYFSIIFTLFWRRHPNISSSGDLLSSNNINAYAIMPFYGSGGYGGCGIITWYQIVSLSVWLWDMTAIV